MPDQIIKILQLLHTLQPGNAEKQRTLHSLWQAAFVRADSCEKLTTAVFFSIPPRGKTRHCRQGIRDLCLKFRELENGRCKNAQNRSREFPGLVKV